MSLVDADVHERLVSQWLDIDGIPFTLYAFILVLIALVYRVMLFLVLAIKKR